MPDSPSPASDTTTLSSFVQHRRTSVSALHVAGFTDPVLCEDRPPEVALVEGVALDRFVDLLQLGEGKAGREQGEGEWFAVEPGDESLPGCGDDLGVVEGEFWKLRQAVPLGVVCICSRWCQTLEGKGLKSNRFCSQTIDIICK